MVEQQTKVGARRTPTRVLLVHHGGSNGGAPISAAVLLRSLCSQGIKCELAVPPGVDMTMHLGELKLTVHELDVTPFQHTELGSFRGARGFLRLISWAFSYRRHLRSMRRIVQEVSPDIVHLNSVTLAPYISAAKAAGAAAVLHVREPVLPGETGLFRWWLRRRVSRDADAVIAICRDNARRLGAPASLVSIVYNPVDFEKFRRGLPNVAARTSLGVASHAPAVLFAGGSMPEIKGLRDYLAAMGKIAPWFPNLVCLMPSFQVPQDPVNRQWTWKRRLAQMGGIYRSQDSLHRLIAEHQLTRRIVRCDFTAAMPNWLAAADVVCVPHVRPHFSRTVLEAGAMAKPVVGYDVGGLTEIVRSGIDGLLVRRGDTEALAEAVSSLLRNREDARRMGESLHARVTALGSESAEHARRVLAVYAKAMAHRDSAGWVLDAPERRLK